VFLNHDNKYGIFKVSFSLKTTNNVSAVMRIIEKNGKSFLVSLIRARSDDGALEGKMHV
jgi:hypothetical protein